MEESSGRGRSGDFRPGISFPPEFGPCIAPSENLWGYVNSILAKREAALAGFDEALFVDDDGFVCEATGENIFLVKDGQVTAVDHPDALPGITRSTVMELAGATARKVRLEELFEADEVFVTGTSAEVTPVSRLNDRVYGAGSVTRALRTAYMDLVHGGTRAGGPG